jgi:hypothetical protein
VTARAVRLIFRANLLLECAKADVREASREGFFTPRPKRRCGGLRPVSAVLAVAVARLAPPAPGVVRGYAAAHQAV